MSVGPSDDVKEQIRAAIDIVDLVGSYLPLRRVGKAYKARCPWHDDHDPSLHVDPERQSYHCFVCNTGGDLFSFVMKMEGVGFPEAKELLAERAGISLRRAKGPGPVPGSPGDKRTLLSAMAWATQAYHECLLSAPQAEPARRYLAERGLAQELVGRFRLGFAPEGWDWLLQRARSTSFSPAVLEAAGLIKRRDNSPGHYDRFRARLLFPIHDTQGRPVALGGRVVPGVGDQEAAKYINSTETPLFSKSEMLYGLDRAKDAVSRSRTVVVMEGYTDCILAHQFGFENATAVLGTALGPKHIPLLKRFAERVILVLDGDEAGRRRTEEVLGLFLSEQIELRVLTLPDELDPADFLLARGADAFRQLLDTAPGALDHVFSLVTAGLGPGADPQAANRALERMLDTLARVPKSLSTTDSAALVKEAQILGQLSQRFAVREDVLRNRLVALRQQHRAAAPSRDAAARPAEPAPAAGSAAPAGTPRKRELAERWLLEVVLQQPELLDRARAEVPAARFRVPAYGVLYARLGALADAGLPADYDHLLSDVEDPGLKSLLVELDVEARSRNRPERERELEPLLDTFRQFAHEERTALAGAAADSAAAGELDRLRGLIEMKRTRQGISRPTEG